MSQSRHGRPYVQRRQDPPPRRDLGGDIDRIFREADQANRAQQLGKDTAMTQTGNLSDLHGPRDVANRIASLERDGVTQLTDPAVIKAMKADELVAAQREGRLLEYMSTPARTPAAEQAAYDRGKADADSKWAKALEIGD